MSKPMTVWAKISADVQLCAFGAPGDMGMLTLQGVFYLNQAAPFGGVKASGHGRFG